MKKNLKLNETLLIASLLFGLFFGAGNLIFPLELGFNSGDNLFILAIGFIISAVGLPILGVVSTALADSENLFELSLPGGKFFAYAMTILLYLTIGPFFAIPRTSTVSFEVIMDSVEGSNKQIALLIFTLIFFGLALVLSMNKAKLLDVIGKYMTPVFLILLLIIIVLSLVNPMGEIGRGVIIDKYSQSPLTAGIIEGYNTMDAPASVAFAIIIIGAIKQMGISDKKAIAIESFKAGLISLVAMGLIYLCLSYIGNISNAIISETPNGAVILARVSNFYLGNFGYMFLSLIVYIACLKTAIGLISACAEIFEQILSFNIGYKGYCIIFSIISFLIANLGLSKIISISLPVLVFLYPLVISLIFLSIMSVFFGKKELLYKSTLIFTAIFSLLDVLNTLPDEVKNIGIVRNILNFANYNVIGFDKGFSWIIPSIIGFVLGLILIKIKKVKKI